MQPLPQPPSVLLLDAGNTLVFLEEVRVAGVLEQHGVTIDPGALRRAQGPAKRRYEDLLRKGGGHEDGWFSYMRVLLRSAGVPEAAAHTLSMAVRQEHDRRNLWCRVEDGLRDALSTLSALGIRLGVVSNSEGQIDVLLEDLGLSSHFEAIVDSGVEGIRKPDPEIFHRALQRMKTRPEDSVYVGDVPAVDVDGARGAGMQAILVDAFDDYPEYVDAPRIRSLTDLANHWLATHRT